MHLTQLIEFINAEKMPTEDELQTRYSHLTIDAKAKETRREYQAILRRQKKQLALDI